MDCKEITKLIADIQTTEMPLRGVLHPDKHEEAESLHQELQELIGLFEVEYPNLTEDFFALIESKEWLLDYLKNGDDQNSTTPRVNGLTGLHSGKKIQNWDYRRFLVEMSGFFEKHQIDQDFAYQYLNTLFFLSYTPEDLPVPYTLLPEALRHKFGMTFKSGSLKADRLTDEAFFWMKGGEVEIGEFGKTEQREVYPSLCEAMEAGNLHAGKVTGNIGKDMRGGVVVVDQAEVANIGLGARGGTAFVKKLTISDLDANVCFGAENGTFVFDNIESARPFMIGAKDRATILIKGQRNKVINGRSDSTRLFNATIAFLDESTGEVTFVDPIHSVYDVKYYHSTIGSMNQFSGVRNLIIPPGEADITFDFTEGGVALVKSVGDCVTVGKGQMGGAIIFDDPKISYEEACRRTAPRSERSGGIVLYLRKWEEPIKVGKLTVGKRKRAEFVEIA